MRVYLSRSLHPQATSLSLLNGGLTAEIAPVHHAHWIFNYEYEISWQDFNHLQKWEPYQLSQHTHTLSVSPLFFPLMNRSSRPCMEGCQERKWWMIFSGWAPKSPTEGKTSNTKALWMIRWDPLNTAQASGGKSRQTEGKHNGWGVLLWSFASFLFFLHSRPSLHCILTARKASPLLHLNPHRRQQCWLQINTGLWWLALNIFCPRPDQ